MIIMAPTVQSMQTKKEPQVEVTLTTESPGIT